MTGAVRKDGIFKSVIGNSARIVAQLANFNLSKREKIELYCARTDGVIIESLINWGDLYVRRILLERRSNVCPDATIDIGRFYALVELYE